MHIRLNIILVFFLSFYSAAYAQCTSGTEVWNKVQEVRGSDLPAQEEIIILKKLQKRCIECNATSDSSYANLLQRMGAVYYSMQDYTQAIDCLKESVRIGSLKNGQTNVAHLSKSYFNLGMSYKERKKLKESIASFDSCIKYSGFPEKNLHFAILAYRNLSNLYLWKGDYQQSVSHAEKGVILAKAQDQPLLEAACLSEKAQALKAMHKFSEASAEIRISIQKYTDELKNTGADNKLLEELANIYTICAEILDGEQQPLKGIMYYKKAYAIFKETNYKYGCFSSLNNIGYIYAENLKDISNASRFYNKALEYSGSAYDTVIYLTNVSTLYFKENDLEKSLKYIQSGFHSLPIRFTEQAYTSNPSIESLVNVTGKVYVLNLFVSKAEIWMKFYHNTNKTQYLHYALTAYYHADKLIDLMRYEQEANESKLFWRENTHKLYENAIEACYLLNKPSEGFYFFEKSKAALLNDQLNEQDWMVKNNEKIFSRLTQYKTDITRWKRELENTSPNDERYDPLLTRIFNIQQEADLLLRQIKSENPYYFNNYLDSNFITLTNVQQDILREYQAFIELFEGDSAVYAMIVTASECQFKKINKTEFDEKTALFTSFISSPSALNKDFNAFVTTSRSLHDLIFGTSPLIAGRIIISPDAKNFPFEALITPAGGKLTYFLEDHAISYTYSARYLLQSASGRSIPDSRDFLGIAPVKYPANLQLSTLYGSDLSLNRIYKNFSYSDLMLFKQASKKQFLQEFSRYKIIQLYTHGSSKDNIAEPVIYFADSILYLSELLIDKKPETDLVILSACETGNGKIYRGEGVFTFNRGFAACGIPASISNLWSVDNESTYLLTELFYKYLMKGIPMDIALQNAKVEFIHNASKENQLPYFWAATILTGKITPVHHGETFNFGKWQIAGIMLMIAGSSMFLRRKVQLNT